MTRDFSDFSVLLKPDSVALVIIDHQDDTLASLSSSARKVVSANTAALAGVAKACDVSVVFSCLVSDNFRGRTWPRLLELFTKKARVRRMIQAGVVPISWRQILFEWYRTIGDNAAEAVQLYTSIWSQEQRPVVELYKGESNR